MLLFYKCAKQAMVRCAFLFSPFCSVFHSSLSCEPMQEVNREREGDVLSIVLKIEVVLGSRLIDVYVLDNYNLFITNMMDTQLRTLSANCKVCIFQI